MGGVATARCAGAIEVLAADATRWWATANIGGNLVGSDYVRKFRSSALRQTASAIMRWASRMLDRFWWGNVSVPRQTNATSRRGSRKMPRCLQSRP